MPSTYVQNLCNELDNNAREISFRMSAEGGPTVDEARQARAFIGRQQAILKILSTRAKKIAP